MILSAVVVTDLNNAMGKDNKLLCHLPADLKFFKSVTLGHPIIMGRKTYDSIGRLLPGRRNIIITRNPDLKVEGAEIYTSFEDVLENVKDEKISVIGGAEIYKLAWPYLTEIYRTLIKHEFEEADTYFPEIKFAEFDLVWEEEHLADEKNPYDYTFQKYIRVN
jgi:dihydrofolate reductase